MHIPAGEWRRRGGTRKSSRRTRKSETATDGCSVVAGETVRRQENPTTFTTLCGIHAFSVPTLTVPAKSGSPRRKLSRHSNRKIRDLPPDWSHRFWRLFLFIHTQGELEMNACMARRIRCAELLLIYAIDRQYGEQRDRSQAAQPQTHVIRFPAVDPNGDRTVGNPKPNARSESCVG
jgi:hypothetical protein